MKILISIFLLATLVIATNLRAAQSYCGELKPAGQFGPYDYTNIIHKQKHLPIVEQHHFSPNVKNLIKGESGTIEGDLNYTLRAFPNHYKALQVVVKLKLRDNVLSPDLGYSVECFFDRAFRFKPKDGIARMIYANYLLKIGGRRADAIEQYQIAVRLEPGSANINYNVGLMYLKDKNYEQAIKYAKKAYQLGFPLPGLRNKLVKTGKWDGELEKKENSEADDESVEEETGIESQ